MKVFFNKKINQHPEPEDVGTITITANIIGDVEDTNKTFTTCEFIETYIEDDECQSKQDLNYFLMEAGINDDDSADALMDFVSYVDDLTCPASDDYFLGCAIEVRVHFIPDYLLDDEEEYSLIVELIQAILEETNNVRSILDETNNIRSILDETNNIRFRPASKLAVTSLTRKKYKKKIIKKRKRQDMEKIRSDIFLCEKCTICLEEFKDEERVVTLPCGHDFHDDECIVKWFETSHVCPLCRYELRCDDQ